MMRTFLYVAMTAVFAGCTSDPGAVTAADVSYDMTTSMLASNNVQGAVDDLAAVSSSLDDRVSAIEATPPMPGPEGPTGPAGAQGPPGLPGAIGADASFTTDTDSDGAADWIEVAAGTDPADPFALPADVDGDGVADVLVGPVGSQGPAGSDGLPGPMGSMGPQGAPGLNGLDGAQGPMGLQGTPGLDGVDGAQGPAGSAGPIGPVGPTGADGVQGLVGPEGVAGPAGPAGVPCVGCVDDASIASAGISRAKLPAAIAYEDEANFFSVDQEVNADLSVFGSIGINTTPDPSVALDVAGEIYAEGLLQVGNTAPVPYRYSLRRLIVEAPPSSIGIVVPIDVAALDRLCRDLDGCTLRIMTISAVGNIGGAPTFVRVSPNNHWGNGSGGAGIDGNGISTEEWSAGPGPCYFTDAETYGGATNARVDNVLGFGLLLSDDGGPATSTCLLIVDD